LVKVRKPNRTVSNQPAECHPICLQERAFNRDTKPLRITKAASKSSVFILLDLSGAFDTVNNQILLSTLSSLGITGTPVHWFESYLTGRTFKDAWRGEVSKAHQLTMGVPQGPLDPSSSPFTPHHLDTSYRHMVPLTNAMLMTHSFSSHFNQMIPK